jgi:tetratricopeptide (TPR) repeat protein
LAAGAGTTARAEARRAVALEPTSAQAYVQLAEVLKHDLVGRSMTKGYDPDGAAAAYRKALELDPSDNESRANLAILLEYNQNAMRYGPGAKMEDALTEYKKVLDKLAGLGIPQNYGVALFRAGKIKELHDYLAKQPEDNNMRVLRICAEALLNGSAAGVREADQVSGVQARQQMLAGAAQTLLIVRQYALAADLFEAANKSVNAANVAQLVQMLRKTKRLEDQDATIRRPEDAVLVLIARILTLDRNPTGWREPLSAALLEDDEVNNVGELKSAMASGLAALKKSGLPMEVALDMAMSAAQFTSEGNDENGWVVRVNMMGSGAGAEQAFFVIRENGNYRLNSAPGEFSFTARLVLKLLDEGKTDLARIWLDRIRQDLPAGDGDDPLSGSMFSRVWQQGQTADADVMRLAAALLLSNQTRRLDTTIMILEKAAKSTDAANANFISAALTEAYYTAKHYDKALAEAEKLVARLPRSPSAVFSALRAAYAGGGKKEADRILSGRLDLFKSNVAAQRLFAFTAMQYGDTDRTISLHKAIVDAGRGTENDFNQLAWADVMAGKVTPATLETAKRGLTSSKNEPASLLHTLATVQVELDQTAEARTSLLQRMDHLAQDEPDDSEWYVFGRIAENFGLSEEATAMYRRLIKPSNERLIASSCYALAQQRLKAMGTAAQ